MPTIIPEVLRDRVDTALVARQQTRAIMTLGGYSGGPLAGRTNPVMNEVMSRASLMTNLLDPRRDLDVECGYPKIISREQYRYLYDREGIANRIVSLYPEECWKKDPHIYETKEETETLWEATYAAIEKEHHLIHYMHRVDEMSGIGRFGLLLVGIDDGLALSEPVDITILNGPNAGRRKGFTETPTAGTQEATPSETVESGAADQIKHKIIYLRVFDESLVDIAAYERDPTNRRYGQPTIYNVMFNDPAALGMTSGSQQTQEAVHWTRVVHIADNRKSSEVFGAPRLLPNYNRVVDLRKLLGASAEMFYKGGFPGFSFEVNPDLGDVTLDAEAMREEFDAYSNGLQRYLAMKGVTAKSLATQVADPEAHIMVQIKIVAITVRAPLRVFMGAEAAHLASEQDQRSWNGRLEHRQTKYLTPRLVDPVFERLTAMGVMPEAGPEGITTDWPELDVSTPDQRASVAEKIVKAVAAYIASGADQLIPPYEFLTMIMGFEADEATAILDAAVKYHEEEDGILDSDEDEVEFDEDGKPIAKDKDGKPIPKADEDEDEDEDDE